VFGIWSQSFGRRRTIIVAALALYSGRLSLGLFGDRDVLAIGAFLMQFRAGRLGRDTGTI